MGSADTGPVRGGEAFRRGFWCGSLRSEGEAGKTGEEEWDGFHGRLVGMESIFKPRITRNARIVRELQELLGRPAEGGRLRFSIILNLCFLFNLWFNFLDIRSMLGRGGGSCLKENKESP